MKSLECDLITKELWKFCSSRGMWVSATYIPGRTNVIADRISREFNDQAEWMLNPAVFFQIIEKLKFFPMIDIFASRLNHQLDKYISWLPDPGSVSVDVFSISWSNIIFYAYPPISMIGAAITNILQDHATGIMIIPYWTTQYWYPTMMTLLVKEPIILPQTKTLITLPFKPEAKHPLIPKTKLLAVLLSGDASLTANFQQGLAKLSWTRGEKPQGENTIQSLDDGKVSALE